MQEMKSTRNRDRQRIEGIRSSSLKEDLGTLLSKLCIEWGFCIPKIAEDKIVNSEELSSDEFAKAVLIAEGMDASVYGNWYGKIKSRFESNFGVTVCKKGYKQ